MTKKIGDLTLKEIVKEHKNRKDCNNCPYNSNHLTNDYKTHLCRISCSNIGLDLEQEIEAKENEDLKAIKETNPSEALDNIKSLLKDDWVESVWKTDYEIIKQSLLKAQEYEEENNFLSNTIKTVNNQYISLMSNYQEQKRVLDILFKKEVDITLLSRSVDFKSYNYSYAYVKGYNFSANELTEEEYNLLERYFNDR